jgi:hypothetical protein
METYISGHSEASFTHTYCPMCAEQYLLELQRIPKRDPRS